MAAEPTEVNIAIEPASVPTETAPTEASQKQSASVAAAPMPAATESGHKKKRKWTAGETIFNFGVYGGISWIVNEILSTIITNTIYFADPAEIAKRNEQIAEQAAKGLAKGEKALKPIKDGMFAKRFNAIVDGMHGVNPFKWGKTPFWLAAEMFVMCIGGTLLVLPTKPIEDRKGKIVRWIDSVFHGGSQDPKLEAAHKEMDEQPKQSWGSLWKGRLLVLASAISLHFFAGAERTAPPIGTTGVNPYVSPTTKWLKGTFMEKYANLSRIMKTGTRDIMSRLPFVNKEARDAMKAARAMEGVPAMSMAEGRVAFALGNTFGYVLSVSAAMATLFFVSSHLFAAARDKKKEQKGEAKAPEQAAAPAPDKMVDVTPKKEERPETPKPQVSTIQNAALMQQNTNALAAR